MKRLAIAGVLGALVLGACTPQQEINVSVNRSASLPAPDELRLGGQLWCNRDVLVDFFVRVTQDGQTFGAGDETVACTDDEPAPWSRTFDIDQGLHTGRASLVLQASTNETGRVNNDFVQIERLVDLS